MPEPVCETSTAVSDNLSTSTKGFERTQTNEAHEETEVPVEEKPAEYNFVQGSEEADSFESFAAEFSASECGNRTTEPIWAEGVTAEGKDEVTVLKENTSVEIPCGGV